MAVRRRLHFIMWRYYGPEFPETRKITGNFYNLRLVRKDITTDPYEVIALAAHLGRAAYETAVRT
jgi:hypothetical protein